MEILFLAGIKEAANRRPFLSQYAHGLERIMAVLADDDMIVDQDAQLAARFLDFLGHFNVRLTGGWVA